MNENNLPWKNETEFYEIHSKDIFSNFAFYHTSMIGKTKEEFLQYIIKNARISKNSKILDLGCGSGYLINALNELGIESIGISTSKECIKQCKLNYPKSKYEIANMENYSPLFKATHILALESIGYSDLEKTFKQTFNNLSENGIFYIKEYAFINHKNNLAIKNKEHFENYWKFKIFTLDEIIKIAINTGFLVYQINNVSQICNNNMFWESREYHKVKFFNLYQQIEYLSSYEFIFIKKSSLAHDIESKNN